MKFWQWLGRLISWVLLAVAVAAVVEQLRRPADERTWQGRIVRIPYDYRPPTLGRLKERWWNPNDERIFTPRTFGVGWAINLYQLRRKALALMG